MSYVPPTEWELRDFFRDHVDAVYRSCCFLSGGRVDAQPIVKSIFEQLLSNGMEFSNERDARAWMILMAYKMVRKAKQQTSADVDQEFSNEIMKLSSKNRLVALLYYCEGYRKTEIANYLGCPTFMIRSRLARVKRCITDENGGEEEC